MICICNKTKKMTALIDDVMNAVLKFLLAIIFSIFSTLSPISMADGVEVDKSVLSRLLAELSAMEPLIDEASRAPKSTGTRLNFDYAALRSDLDLIKSGINDYLQSPTLPRVKPIKPMNGHYAQ